MKILTVSNYFPEHPGGVEFVAQNLVLRWRQHHQVCWAACDVKTHPHVPHPDDLLLPASNLAETRLGFPYPLPAVQSIPLLFKAAKGSDIVHIHDCLYFANLVAVLASIHFSKPLVVTQHVGLVPYRDVFRKTFQGIAYRTIGRLVLKKAQRTIFINQQVRDWFEQEMRLQKTALIPNGVNQQIFYPAGVKEKQAIRNKLGFAADDCLLLFIGRYTQKKGIHIIKEIARSRPHYKWIIIGRGESDIPNWNLPNVRVLPAQPQAHLRDFYAAADLFVLPSTGEGFPLAVQEALSCGLPAAVSEEIAESQPGAPLLRLETTSLPQILNTLDEILGHPVLRSDIAARSIEYAKQWDWDIAAQKYEHVFADTIGQA